MIKNGLAIVGGVVIVYHICRLYARYVEGKYARIYGASKQPEAA
jgi:hypothetical protein